MICRDCANDRDTHSEAGLCAACEVKGWRYEAQHPVRGESAAEAAQRLMDANAQIAVWSARTIPSPFTPQITLKEAA